MLKTADDICNEMMSNFNLTIVKTFAFVMTKIFKAIYEKIVIDEGYIEKI